MTDYRVTLDVYNGPLDLLLFLIKREEIDIYDIPIAHITVQYLQYVELLRELDPEVIGDFLVLAATLMEIKSRSLLPRPPAVEDDEELADPRLELVRQLLEYKRFKDAAYSLGEAADERAQQHARVPVLPAEPDDGTDLENVEVWDLFDAFNRLLEQTGKRSAYHEVSVDDTPITLHAEDILDALQRTGGEQKFEEIFAGRNRAEMIGLFLALLELIRRQRVKVRQDDPTANIIVQLLDATPLTNGSFETETDGPERSLDLNTRDQSVTDKPSSVATDDSNAAKNAPETELRRSLGSTGHTAVVDEAELHEDEVLSDTGRAMKTANDPLPALADMPSNQARLATPNQRSFQTPGLTPQMAGDSPGPQKDTGSTGEGGQISHDKDQSGETGKPHGAAVKESSTDHQQMESTSETADAEREQHHDTQ